MSNLKKGRLEKELAALAEEHEAATRQLTSTLGEIERRRLRGQLENLERREEEIDNELRAWETAEDLKNNEDYQNRRHLNLDCELPKINFIEALTIFQDIWGGFDGKGGAVLFLLKNSDTLCGRLFVNLMLDELKKGTKDLKHYPLEFIPPGRLDEMGILDGLARHVNVSPLPDNLDQYLEGVISKMCGALQNGSVIFIDLKISALLQPQESMLAWFVENFWGSLIRQMPNINLALTDVRIVALINAGSEIRLPQPLCCGKDSFHSERALELPLQNWTKEEIRRWLSKFAGRFSQLPPLEIEKYAERLYEESQGGLPVLVRNNLADLI